MDDNSTTAQDYGAPSDARSGADHPRLLLHERLALHRATERLIAGYFRTVRLYCDMPPEPTGRPAPSAVRRSALPPSAGKAAAAVLWMTHLVGLLSLDAAVRPHVLVTLGGLTTVVVATGSATGRIAADLAADAVDGTTFLRLMSTWAAPLLAIACIVSGTLGAEYTPGTPWMGAVLLGFGPMVTACVEAISTHPDDRAGREIHAALERAGRARRQQRRRIVRAVRRWGRAHRALARRVERLSARAPARRRRVGPDHFARPRAVLSALAPNPRTAAEAARVISDVGGR